MSENGESSPSESPKKLTLAPKDPVTPPPAEESSVPEESPVASLSAETTESGSAVTETAEATDTSSENSETSVAKPLVKPAVRPSAIRPGVKPLARPGLAPKVGGAAVARPGTTAGASAVALPTTSRTSTATRTKVEDDLDDLDDLEPASPLASPAWIIVDAIAAGIAISGLVLFILETSAT